MTGMLRLILTLLLALALTEPALGAEAHRPAAEESAANEPAVAEAGQRREERPVAHASLPPPTTPAGPRPTAHRCDNTSPRLHVRLCVWRN